jgi:hypothetical protein
MTNEERTDLYWLFLDGSRIVFTESSEYFRRPENPGTLFGVGIRADKSGKPKLNRNGDPMTVTAIKMSAGRSPYASLIFPGTITVVRSGLMHDVNSDGSLDTSAAKRMYTLTTTNSSSGITQTATVAASVIRKTNNVEWLDLFGLEGVESAAQAGKYIRAIASRHKELYEDTLLIGAIGHINLDAETGEYILVTPSGSYDADGKHLTNKLADITKINPPSIRNQHDITVATNQDDVIRGLTVLRKFLTLSESYPELPARAIGQLVSAGRAYDFRFGSASWLYAPMGTGKTQFELWVSAIQSKTHKPWRSFKPDVNLGDQSGTVKGPGYKIDPMGLGTLLADDIVMASQPLTKRVERAQVADNMWRGYLNGAGSKGTFSRITGVVGANSTGQLRTSIRFTGELPPPDGTNGEKSSLADRMIVQGGWDNSKQWYDIFNADTFEEIGTPENVYAAHLAYSALYMWAWTHEIEMEECYSQAKRITRQWDVNRPRITEAYTSAVAGLIAVQRVAREYDHELGTDDSIIDNAIRALENGAYRQTSSTGISVNLREVFLKEMRLRFKDSGLAVASRPILPGSSASEALVYPCDVIPAESTPEGIDRLVWPDGLSPADLGMIVGDARTEGRPKPKNPRALIAYLIPPSKSNNKGVYGADWSIGFSKETLTLLCRDLTYRRKSDDGIVFAPDRMKTELADNWLKIRHTVIPSSDEPMGKIAGNPTWVYQIPISEIFNDTNEDDES